MWIEQRILSSAVRTFLSVSPILDSARIFIGGENISSVALGSILVTHPALLEAGVVAVEDAKWGERPKAFVTVKSGHAVTAEAVIEWARHNPEMSRLMVPRAVEVVPELPKTSTGKVKKNVLREWTRAADRTVVR